MTSLSDLEIVPLSHEYEEGLKNLFLEFTEGDLRNLTKLGEVMDEEVATRIAAAKAGMAPEKERTVVLLDRSRDRIVGYTSQIYFSEPRKDWCRPGGLFVSRSYRRRRIATMLEGYNVEEAKRLGKKIHASVHADNEGMIMVLRSLGYIVEGLFINQERWGDKPVDIIPIAHFTDGSITQEESTKRYLEAARRARDSKRSSPVAPPSGFEVVPLSPEHKDCFEDFLLGLDRETLRNSTRFGIIIEEEAAKRIATEKARIEPEREQGFIMLDKTSDKIASYSHLEFSAAKARSPAACSGLVISPAYKGRGVGKVVMERVIEEAKEIGIEKIWTNVYWDDKERFELACSLGFTVEAVFVNREKWDEELRSVISMALLISEPVTQEEAMDRYLETLQGYYKKRKPEYPKA